MNRLPKKQQREESVHVQGADLLLPDSYVDWVLPFLRRLDSGREEELIKGRKAIRDLIQEGALPSVFSPAIYRLVEIGLDLVRPTHRRQYPGAYEQRVRWINSMVVEVKEVIQLRRQIAEKSAQLNQSMESDWIPSEVLHKMVGGADKPEPLSRRDSELLRTQPDKDRACADILERKLPLWQRLARRRTLPVTRKFLLYFLYRYVTLRTGQAHAQQIVDLLNAAIYMTPSSLPGQAPALAGRSRGKKSGDDYSAYVEVGNLYSLASKFPREHPAASKDIERWAQNEATKGRWQPGPRRNQSEAGKLADEFDRLISALVGTPQPKN